MSDLFQRIADALTSLPGRTVTHPRTGQQTRWVHTPVEAIAEALSGVVVADPAEVELWRDVADRRAIARDAAQAERDRLRAALNDIAALVAPQWRTSHGADYTQGRNDLIDAVRAVLARHGFDQAGEQPFPACLNCGHRSTHNIRRGECPVCGCDAPRFDQAGEQVTE